MRPRPEVDDDPVESHARMRLFLSLHLPAVALGLGTGITQPVLPVLAESFEVGIGLAATVFIAQMVGGAVGTLPTGHAIDRIGRRKIMLAGPVIVAIASFLTATAGSIPELLVYRFVAGWGQQMWMLARLTVIADTGRADQRGKQITGMFSSQRVGMLAGPAIGGFTAAAWGLGVPFVIHGVFALLAVIPSFFIVSETRALALTPQSAPGDGPSPMEPFDWRSLLAYPFPMVFLGQFMANLARGGIEGGGVLFLYAVYAYGASTATLGVLSSVMAAVGIPIALFAGWVMDRFGRKWTIVPGSTLLSMGLLFMAATSFWSLSFTMFLTAFVTLHLTVNLMIGSMQTLGTDIAPPQARGRFFGVSRLVAQSGRISSPGSFAIFSEFVGFGAAFVFMAGSAAVAAITIGRFVKETLRRL